MPEQSAMQVPIDRRLLLKATAWGAGGVGLAALLAACGADGATSDGPGGTLTLRMPFLQDMQVPDPDIMYEGEGVQVMHALYDGLVQYEPGTSEIRPMLAESWTVSEDLLTYTFTLRPGVRFHDGTTADAAAWVKSFERRLKVNQGPAYMVADAVATAKDASTLVVTLKAPNDAFLHYLACPWHPYAVSPAAVEQNAKDGDLAQEWLKTHDAGTGPYVMKEFLPGSHYTLEAFDGYWGGPVAYKSIRIQITPDVSTQKLQLDQGAFDVVATNALPIPDIQAYQKNPEFTVQTGVGVTGWAVWIKSAEGIFRDRALREALILAVDRGPIVSTAFGDLTEVSKALWLPSMFPAELAPWPTAVDPAPLKSLVAALPDKKIDLAWGADGGAPVQLQGFGFEATVRQLPTAEQFDLVNQPQEKRPDLLVTWLGGDALHLDTVLRIMLRTGAAPLNLMSYSNTELDRLMDEAVKQPTREQVQQVYAEATKLIMAEALYIPLCPAPVPVVAHGYLKNVRQNSAYPAIIDVSKITRS